MKALIALMLMLGIAMPALAAEKKAAPKKKPAAESKEKEPTKAEAAADSLTASQKTKLLKTLNEGDDKDLSALPGVGDVRAAAIKKARPIKAIPDLLKVDGIGEDTYNEIIKSAKSGSTAEKAPAKKKAAPKKKTSS